jgi:hypothetical protein
MKYGREKERFEKSGLEIRVGLKNESKEDVVDFIWRLPMLLGR